MDHIEADEFDYYLTDEDYVRISKKLKDDIYEMGCFLKDNEFYDSNFQVSLNVGSLDIYYQIQIKGNVPIKKDDITTDMITQLDVFFWGADRDGAEWDREVDFDMSKIKF